MGKNEGLEDIQARRIVLAKIRGVGGDHTGEWA